ncbi:hypothetical protein OBCHQ24_12540 [Oceanobacillus iheyensis]|nr:hypothetical protein OBCHQ24_12540 [Oceanobacillus iheyensis]
MNRRPLRDVENFHLWMASGGICSFEGCSKRLIQNTNGSLTNVGIKAHIIGHAKNSARHEYMEEYEYTQAQLEDVSNLMLMCYDHSKIIDDEKTREQFPPDRLFAMKNKHEKWIASRSQEQKKKSIALIHKRLGAPLTDIEFDGEAPYILIEAVEEQTEFIEFTCDGWEEGKRKNEVLYEEFSARIREREANAVEIFPLSPIPLLAHMGFLLTDTVSLSIYQFDREREVWVSDKPQENEKVEIKITKDSNVNGKRELAVIVSVSGTVKVKDINETMDKPFDSLSFTINNPGLKRVLYREDVKFIQSIIKDEVEELIQQQDYNRIHLFLAVPAGLAIELGRGINPRMWGEVCLYQYDRRTSPRYQYALSLL